MATAGPNVNDLADRIEALGGQIAATFRAVADAVRASAAPAAGPVPPPDPAPAPGPAPGGTGRITTGFNLGNNVDSVAPWFADYVRNGRWDDNVPLDAAGQPTRWPAKFVVQRETIGGIPDPLGYQFGPQNETWVLTWTTGATPAPDCWNTPSRQAGGLTVGTPARAAGGNRLEFTVNAAVPGQPVQANSPDVFVTWDSGPGEWHCWRRGHEGEDFSAEFLAQLGRPAVLRGMDTFHVNNDGASRHGDVSGPGRVIGGKVVLVGPADNPQYPYRDGNTYDAYDGQQGRGTPVTCAFAAPHGLVPGQWLDLDVQLGPFPTADGATLTVPPGTYLVGTVPSDTTAVLATVKTDRGTVSPFGTTHFVAANATNRVGGETRVTYEDFARLCAAVGADPWVNVHGLMDDEGCRAIAAVFAGRRQRAYLELSNEPWNAAFRQWSSFGLLGHLSGPMLTPLEWYARRSCEVTDIFKGVYRDAGADPALVLLVANTQIGDPGRTEEILDQYKALGRRPDCLAGAPYLSQTPDPADADPADSQERQTTDGLDTNGLLDRLGRCLGSDGYTKAWDAHKSSLSRHGMTGVRLVHYEGGVENLLYRSGLVDPAMRDAGARMKAALAALRHPGMGEVVGKYLGLWGSLGVDLHVWYTFSGTYWHAPNGEPLLYGAVSGYRQPPGVGDGSDGLNDNRVDPFTEAKVCSPVLRAVRAGEGRKF